MRSPPAVLAVLTVGCSLLAPDDAYFVGGAGGGQGGGGGADDVCEPAPACGALPEPDVVLTAADIARLPALVANATPNTTIGLEPGTYVLTSSLEVRADGVTLQSTTGNAADVVVNAGLPSIISIASSDVTLAGITLTGSSMSGVVLNPPERSERVRLCGMVIRDAGRHFVTTAEDAGYADCALIENSTMELTDAGRATACCPSCTGAGVRVERGRGWVVRGSRISGFFCTDTAGACSDLPVGLLFYLGARDTLLENNHIVDAARGIILGYTLTSMAPRSYADAPYGGVGIDHYDGIVRNNIIVGHPLCFDTGMEINRAREPRIFHNTVLHLGDPATVYAAIDRRFPTTFARVENNLVRGGIRIRDCGEQDCTGLLGPTNGNHEIADLAMFPSYFVDPTALDFHLLPGAPAIDQGVPLEDSGVDLDGEPHDAGVAPDVGADEFR